MLAASAMDDALARLLWRYFWMAHWKANADLAGETEKQSLDFKDEVRNLFLGGGQPLLGSFWSRIMMCRALGLLEPETLERLLELKDLRNRFAHAPYQVELTDDNIKSIGATKRMENLIDDRIAPHAWEMVAKISESKNLSVPRKQFIGICSSIYATISYWENMLATGRVGPWQPTDKAAPTTPLPPLE